VVGQEWRGDVRIVLFVRLRDGLTLDDGLVERIRRRIRDHTSPHHVPRKILQVPDIPRTISGKITELAVRDVIHGREVKNVDAMANPGALRWFVDREELRGSAPGRWGRGQQGRGRRVTGNVLRGFGSGLPGFSCIVEDAR
jgi:acetoacetyl-CoA synthetase